jgi:hypothetical protein
MKYTFVITTIIGIPIDFVKTPSGSGRTTCSSLLFKLAGVVVDAIETDEREVGIRPAEMPFFIVVDDDEDDIIIIDESFGSI